MEYKMKTNALQIHSRRSFQSIFLVLCFLIWTQIVSASQVVLPKQTDIDHPTAFLQTNGKDANIDDGDWWTSAAHGNQPHLLKIDIPSGVSNFNMAIELFDPESYSTDVYTDPDEQNENLLWEDTRFRLLDSDQTTVLYQQVYPGGSAATNQQWVSFYNLNVSGPHVYYLQVSIEKSGVPVLDDQNGYCVRIANGNSNGNEADGNEIGLFALRTAFQLLGSGNLSYTFGFYVPPMNELHLYNFDMDAEGPSNQQGPVVYIDPSGVEYAGTASGWTKWNTGGLSLPASGGDVISNPTPGWWQAKFSVKHETGKSDDGNQFIFWPSDLPYDGSRELGAILGDRVWRDANQNGLQDAGEAGVGGITVRLLRAADLAVLRTTSSAPDGSYQFNNLPAGSYRVEFIANPSWFFTPSLIGSNRTIDSDADPGTGQSGVIDLAENRIKNDVDAGLIPKHISNLVIRKSIEQKGFSFAPNSEITFALSVTNEGPDAAENVRIMDPLPSGVTYISATPAPTSSPEPLIWYEASIPAGTTVTYRIMVRTSRILGTYENCAFISSPNRDENLSNNSHCIQFYIVEQPPETSNNRIGDRVWQDVDGDGVQDGDEAGLANIKVILLSSPGSYLIDSTLTDTHGIYQFVNIAPGSYIIAFQHANGYHFSPSHQGSDDLQDSDANEATGRTEVITVTTGEVKNGWDAGMVRSETPGRTNIRIGNFVWHDLNANGTQDGKEPGLKDIQVNLLTDGSNILVATTLTNAYGLYEFVNIPTGAYRLEFILPVGMRFTLPDQGDNNQKDSDVDPGSGRTVPFIMAPQQADSTWDAGLVKNDESDLTVIKTVQGSSTYYFRNQDVAFNLLVTNHGPDVAKGVRIVDTVPDGLLFVSASPAETAGPNPLTWLWPELGVGSSVSISVVMRTTEQLGGMDNCVNVSSLSTDPKMADNVSCAQIHILVPVELNSFSAQLQGTQVMLQWITQSETENLGFHLLRAEAEEGPYNQITSELIKGAGTSSSSHAYHFEDLTAIGNRTFYYKLVDVDFNGQLSLHGPINVTVALPTTNVLEQNYPNPFNPSTRIRFILKEAGMATLSIFNVKGEQVRELLHEQKSSGAYIVEWDGMDQNGRQVPSGMYFYSLRINGFEQKRMMMFLK
jgi:uncharacterized repeat protein (TIGR01451 family)